MWLTDKSCLAEFKTHPVKGYYLVSTNITEDVEENRVW